MFPWVDGFHWTADHIIFLSLFGVVVVTILTTFVSAVWLTVRDFRAERAADLSWRLNFAELPEAERRCRHQLAGRVPARTCNNAFDCRHCVQYAEFAALPVKAPAGSGAVNFSHDLFYHRGHTWVRPENDGTLTIGLDEFAEHLIGHPDSVELPKADGEIKSNGVAWRMIKNGHEIRVRAPLDGEVVATGGYDRGWYLKLRPHGVADLRHLLHGEEVPGWLAAETERLQHQLAGPDAPPCLADGGTLMPDLMDALPSADWDAVLGAAFLEG